MWANARNDLFNVQFSKGFFEPSVLSHFEYYKSRLTEVHVDFASYLNSTIKSIQLPALSYEKTEQLRPGWDARKRGKTILHRPAAEPAEVFEREFTITFEATEGYLNYWIMFTLFLHYYDFPTKQKYIPDITLNIMDLEGNIIFQVIYHDVLYIGMSEIELSHSSNDGSPKTFECSFDFIDYEFKFLRS